MAHLRFITTFIIILFCSSTLWAADAFEREPTFIHLKHLVSSSDDKNRDRDEYKDSLGKYSSKSRNNDDGRDKHYGKWHSSGYDDAGSYSSDGDNDDKSIEDDESNDSQVDIGYIDVLPILSIPPSISVEAASLHNTVVLGTATAIDFLENSTTVTNDALETFPLGTTTVIYSATDAAGNTATATQTVTVVDTTIPVLNIPANTTIEATAPQTSVTLGTATATDIFGVAISSDAPATFPVGITTITYTATDGNGLTSTGTQTVTVIDTTAPAISVPANISIEANAVLSTVSVGTATASDLVDGTVSVSNDDPTTFPLGTTTITYSATDAAGNTATATQTVTVVDTTVPVLSIPANVTTEATASQTSVTLGTATATDIFGVSITSDAPVTFPVGITTVTYTVADGNGLTSTGMQTVTVTDTTAPAILAPANITTEATAVLSTISLGTATKVAPTSRTVFKSI